MVQPSSKYVEGTPLGPLDGSCLPSPRPDESFKMADNEKDCSGEIYRRYKQGNVEEARNCDIL